MLTVLAIDPGRAKCGVAVVAQNGDTRHRAIVPPDALIEAVRALCDLHAPVAILIGDGTGSRPIREAIEAARLASPIVPIDESHSSEAARARFVAENPARGWQRLLPQSLRTPDRPYDDYVAILLAERWWRETSAPSLPPAP